MLTSADIKRFASEAGFDLCGITTPEVVPAARERYSKWLASGYHGESHYLTRDPDKRTDPSRLLKGLRSVIMLAVNYYQENSTDEVPAGYGRVSRYARGRDYHRVVEKSMRTLISRIEEESGLPGVQSRTFVDYGPMLERTYAEKAGLGYIGKNSMLISRRFGSWLFLSGIITTLELEPDDPHAVNHGRCGKCRLCIDACPTGAIMEDGSVDSRKCISYLTIEKPDKIPNHIARQIDSLIFGCDICQEVCPHNGRAVATQHQDFLPENGVGELLNIKRLLSLQTRAQFLELAAGTPLTRPKLPGVKRIAEIVSTNQTRVE
jgi:epoxyqueuosine reductase